jgi:NAD-dependent SIR2 family protein deacetylase
VPLINEPRYLQPLYSAFHFTEDSDLFIALGAKFEPPLDLLPYYARSYRAKVIFVQETSTPYENIADVVLTAKPSQVMKELINS